STDRFATFRCNAFHCTVAGARNECPSFFCCDRSGPRIGFLLRLLASTTSALMGMLTYLVSWAGRKGESEVPTPPLRCDTAAGSSSHGMGADYRVCSSVTPCTVAGRVLMRNFLRTTCMGAVAVFATGAAHANDELIRMSQNPKDWVMPTGDYANQRYSKLK